MTIPPSTTGPHEDLSSVALAWSESIEKGEQPALFSKRDGVKLSKIPRSQKIAASDACGFLHQALVQKPWLQDICKDLGTSRKVLEGRGELSLLRAVVYLQAGLPELAAKDAQTAIVYGSKRCGVVFVAASHAVMAEAKELLQDALLAAFHMQKAHELQPCNSTFMGEARRLAACLEDEGAQEALQLAGSEGLELWQQKVKEMQLPEFLRPRPKYHFYNKWMRERIDNLYPGLPEPVVKKLLEVDAGDLHFLCQHPPALAAQAEEYQDVYQQHGEQYLLQQYEGEPLTWEEIKALTGQDTVGLPIGYDHDACEQGERFDDEARAMATEIITLAARRHLTEGGAGPLSRKALLLEALSAHKPAIHAAGAPGKLPSAEPHNLKGTAELSGTACNNECAESSAACVLNCHQTHVEAPQQMEEEEDIEARTWCDQSTGSHEAYDETDNDRSLSTCCPNPCAKKCKQGSTARRGTRGDDESLDLCDEEHKAVCLNGRFPKSSKKHTEGDMGNGGDIENDRRIPFGGADGMQSCEDGDAACIQEDFRADEEGGGGCNHQQGEHQPDWGKGARSQFPRKDCQSCGGEHNSLQDVGDACGIAGHGSLQDVNTSAGVADEGNPLPYGDPGPLEWQAGTVASMADLYALD